MLSQALAAALKVNTAVTTVDLEYCEIGDEAAKARSLRTYAACDFKHHRECVHDWLQQLEIVTLLLVLQLLGAEQALACALEENATVTHINLRQCKIGFAGAQAPS